MISIFTSSASQFYVKSFLSCNFYLSPCTKLYAFGRKNPFIFTKWTSGMTSPTCGAFCTIPSAGCTCCTGTTIAETGTKLISSTTNASLISTLTAMTLVALLHIYKSIRFISVHIYDMHVLYIVYGSISCFREGERSRRVDYSAKYCTLSVFCVNVGGC